MKKVLVVLHCSATKPSQDIGAREIRKWHTDPQPEGRGWSDIGYHYVIRRNGVVEPGRPLNRQGAHVRGFNRGTIAICLVGGVDRNLRPTANFTRAQYGSVVETLQTLREKFEVISIYGHRDFPDTGKACPSFSVAALVYRNFIR